MTLKQFRTFFLFSAAIAAGPCAMENHQFLMGIACGVLLAAALWSLRKEFEKQ